jgi:hypothetical protein
VIGKLHNAEKKLSKSFNFGRNEISALASRCRRSAESWRHHPRVVARPEDDHQRHQEESFGENFYNTSGPKGKLMNALTCKTKLMVLKAKTNE